MHAIEGALRARCPNTPKQKPTEDRHAFLKRVLKFINKLPDAAWDKFHPNVQDWYNDNADRLNHKKTLLDFEEWRKVHRT